MRKVVLSQAHLTENNRADIYEVAVIIGSCFIVNYVTADSKTNWAEGVSMIAFYCMIVSRCNPYLLYLAYRHIYEGSMCLVLSRPGGASILVTV
jgi:hypothetical protein